MGDSGAMLPGFVMATIPLQGLLKTASIVALFFPLLVLAVPILDTGFVVARRLKYHQPITAPDRTHLHHRFVNIGFSQPRAVLYIYFWVATLAAAALGTRFIPFREGGHWHTGGTIPPAALGGLAPGASGYKGYPLPHAQHAESPLPPAARAGGAGRKFPPAPGCRRTLP